MSYLTNMSLATTSLGSAGAGGAGAGGIALSNAHMAMRPSMANAPPQFSSSSGAASSARVGLPGNQNVTTMPTNQIVMNDCEFPIVCMDLYGDGEISYVAPSSITARSSPQNNNTNNNNSPFTTLGKLGECKSDLVLKAKDEASYKALRKLLSKGGEKGKGYYNRVISSTVVTDSDSSSEKTEDNLITISSPHLLMGTRKISQLHPVTLNKYHHSTQDEINNNNKKGSAVASAIQPNVIEEEAKGLTIRNQSLDGCSPPNGDDFDRVTVHVDLLPKKKKPLAILPDEALNIVLGKARHFAHTDYSQRYAEALHQAQQDNDDDDDEDPEDSEIYLAYPTAVAIPGWHLGDPQVETYMDQLQETNNSENLIFLRSVAALVGAFLPNELSNTNCKSLTQSILKSWQATAKELQLKANDPKNQGKDVTQGLADKHPWVLAVSVTKEGIEAIACQFLPVLNGNGSADIKVLTQVSYQHENPMSQIQSVLETIMEDTIQKILPKPYQIPVAIMTYGATQQTQEKVKTEITNVLKDKQQDWEMVKKTADGKKIGPVLITSHESCVTVGACAMATQMMQAKTSSNSIMNIKNVTSCALGIRVSFTSENTDDTNNIEDSNVKTIFDFDRRAPANTSIEFTAAECAAVLEMQKKKKKLNISEMIVTGVEDDQEGEELLQKFKKGDTKTLQVREQAAKKLHIQMVQKYQRNGKWIAIGPVMQPLVWKKSAEEKDDDDNEDSKDEYAIESSTLDISINSAGTVITKALSSDG